MERWVMGVSGGRGKETLRRTVRVEFKSLKNTCLAHALINLGVRYGIIKISARRSCLAG
jgi:hypothetical protein